MCNHKQIGRSEQPFGATAAKKKSLTPTTPPEEAGSREAPFSVSTAPAQALGAES